MKLSNIIVGVRRAACLICLHWVAFTYAGEAETPEVSTPPTAQNAQSVAAPKELKVPQVVSSNPKTDPAPEDEAAKTDAIEAPATLRERVQIFIPSEEIDTEKAVAFPTNI